MITEPELSLLPARLWLIGLGHLGQAYLWALGLLPFARPQDLRLVLQDIDIITPSTESTSVLSNAALIGQKKTRVMAAWAERRGFLRQPFTNGCSRDRSNAFPMSPRSRCAGSITASDDRRSTRSDLTSLSRPDWDAGTVTLSLAAAHAAGIQACRPDLAS